MLNLTAKTVILFNTGETMNSKEILKKEIYEKVCGLGGGVSFVELEKINNFCGDCGVFLGSNSNLLLWNKVSQDASDAIKELLEENLIITKVVNPIIYAVDGKVLSLPLAKRISNKKSKNLKWLPVVFDKVKQ